VLRYLLDGYLAHDFLAIAVTDVDEHVGTCLVCSRLLIEHTVTELKKGVGATTSCAKRSALVDWSHILVIKLEPLIVKRGPYEREVVTRSESSAMNQYRMQVI
jgi:hypothetical protein